MITRIKIPLSEDEYLALFQIAEKEERNPVNHMRFILRQELSRLGVLPQSPVPQDTRHEVKP